MLPAPPADGIDVGVVEVLLVALALVAVYVAIQLRRIAKGGRKADGGEDEGFQVELEVRQLHRDVAQLRAALDAQRARVAELDAQLQAQQRQFVESQALGVVSPEYDEALVFARRGVDVETIAERCGITVAEAALVRALAQRRGEPKEPG